MLPPSLAGLEVTLYGRIEVTPEGQRDQHEQPRNGFSASALLLLSGDLDDVLLALDELERALAALEG